MACVFACWIMSKNLLFGRENKLTKIIVDVTTLSLISVKIILLLLLLLLIPLWLYILKTTFNKSL